MQSASRIGIIDLGTNSVRFDVYDVAKRTPRLLHREKLMLRLGENVFTSGHLDPHAIRRTLQAFASFQATAHDLKVGRMVAFGTSALREAEDGPRLAQTVRRGSGIDLKIISGPEEARLIADGILANDHRAQGDTALVDIGGGSTEISIRRDGRLIFSESLPLGAARLQQVFLKTIPPTPGENGSDPIRALRKHVRRTLRERLGDVDLPRNLNVIGSSGTIKALQRLCKKNGARGLELDRLRKLNKRMAGLTLAELGLMPGMEPRRVDLILAGGLLFEECLRALGAKSATFTGFALRDGILYRELRAIRPQRPQPPRLDNKTLATQAARFGESALGLKHSAELAEVLFRRLLPLHRLDRRWLAYLKIAVLYRGSGRIISPIEFEKHSAYIARHADLPVRDAWEHEFVSQLCLHHNGGKIARLSLPFPEPHEVNLQRNFLRLLALLRVVDALDPAQHTQRLPRRIRIDRTTVHITLAKGPNTDLALLRLERRKDLFEQVFARTLTAGAR